MITAHIPIQQYVANNICSHQQIDVGSESEMGVHPAAEACLRSRWGEVVVVGDCIPATMASLLKAHTPVTSKLKSSLMLFIFKCSLLDRRHLVRHTSHGRARRSSAPSRADSRSALTPKQWHSLETCSGICHNPAPREEKHKRTRLLVYTHIQICRNTCLPTSASATTLRNEKLFAKKHVKDFFFLCSINVDKSFICGEDVCCKCHSTGFPSVWLRCDTCNSGAN